MEKLLRINEKDIFPEAKEQNITYWDREAARAVLLDQDGNIALMHVSARNYYKLPGGGVEKGESIEVAAERECMEETGCKIKIGAPIGVIEEFRDQSKVHQTSYCFFAEVVGKKGETAFVGDEITDKFKLLWVPLDQAITLTESANPQTYDGKFIQQRDLTFLKHSKELQDK